MVFPGETTVVPDGGTLPMPWSILIVVASSTNHRKVADSPVEISDGIAMKARMTGGDGRQATTKADASSNGRSVETVAVFRLKFILFPTSFLFHTFYTPTRLFRRLNKRACFPVRLNR